MQDLSAKLPRISPMYRPSWWARGSARRDNVTAKPREGDVPFGSSPRLIPRPTWKSALPLLALTALLTGGRAAPGASAPITWVRVVQQGDSRRVEIGSDHDALLVSPPEGLWSISCGWDDWPTDWRHASPVAVEHAGEWTILRGSIAVPGGVWELRDAYRPWGRTVKCVRRFTWTGKEKAKRSTLSVRFRAATEKAAVLLPGIIYHGNPSGARSGRVPVFTGRVGEEAIFEEHRYPAPYASLEWSAGDARRGAALHTLPSPAPFGNLQDQWWSLGVAAVRGATEILLLSGPCASNGKRNVIKAVQPGFAPYNESFLEAPPGAVIEKTFFLEAYPVHREGSGFRRPLESALELHQPFSSAGLPTFEEIVRAKYRFALSRWQTEPDVAGFRKYPDRPFFVIGWCGQAAALGYALQVLATSAATGVVTDGRPRGILAASHRLGSPDGDLIRVVDETLRRERRHELWKKRLVTRFTIGNG